MSKKSIRFFNDREVRAVWDEERSKWWFSATDIVRAINDEEDYVKAGNYWRWLKKKLAAMGWHCITVWECELTPKKREETLESIAFTLNHIWLQDHGAKAVPYPKLDEEKMQMPMAAEDEIHSSGIP